MKMRVVEVHNHGDADQEYVLLTADEACNLKWFPIYDATFVEPGKISNKQRHFYKFHPKEVNAGDWVSLRTGKGRNESFVNNDGETIHRFYWGLDHPVWNDDGDAAVLLEIQGWRTTYAG